MVMMTPIGDLVAGDHVQIGQHPEIPSGSYTVASIESLDDDGQTHLTLTPDDGGDPVEGDYDGDLEVGVG